MRKKLFWKYLGFIARISPYIFVFCSSLYLPSDPDLGWHLKYGEYFFKYHKLLRNNTFSTMMPNFHWANGSWGTDIITYAIYHNGGFLSLAIAGAAIVTASFYFYARTARMQLADEVLFFPILVYLEYPLNIVSFRGQQISLLFTGILFYLLSKYTPFSKIIFYIPLLILLWVNVHEEVFLFLLLFAIWITFIVIRDYYYALNKQYAIKEAIFLGFVFILSMLATLINPFGIGIHLDAISHFGNPLLYSVNEYRPFIIFTQLWWNQIFLAVIILIALVYLYYKHALKFNLPVMGVAFILFALSFQVERYAWPAYYMILPIIQPVAFIFEPTKRKNLILFALIIMSATTTINIMGIPLRQITNPSWNMYCQQGDMLCSPRSAQFIKDHKLTNNVLSLYDWGGWLIWNYPEIKPSIDGRMHLWKDASGYSAFADYYAYEGAEKNIDTSKFDVVYMPWSKPLYFQMLYLVRQKRWKLAYHDDYAGVFVRNKK